MHRRSRARLATVLVLVASLAGLVPAGAAAATTSVRMAYDYDFHAATVSIARGGVVKWSNPEASQIHDVKSKLSGYFTSPGGVGGIRPGHTYTKTFKQAGTFGYLCRLHQEYGMTGTVVVPIKVGRSGSLFIITVASASTSGTRWRNRIQVRKPGASAWTAVTTTTAKSATFVGSRHGTYQFRSAVKNHDTGATSGWSPIVSRTR